MDTAIRQGGTGGRCARPVSALSCTPSRMRVAAACALISSTLILTALATPARAAVLYRCKGDQGEIVFASHIGHYKGCRVISGIESAPRARHVPKPLVESTTIPAATLQDEPIVATAAAAAGSVQAQPIPVAQVPITDAPAPNPAVITVTPLRDAGAPVVRELPPVGMTALSIAEPWPISVLDAVATDLLPHLLTPRVTAPAHTASSAPPLVKTVPAPAPVVAMPPSLQHDASLAVVNNPRPSYVSRRGAVYRIARADGSIEYTNVATRARGANARMLFTYIMRTCVACDVHSRVDWNNVTLQLDAYNDDIRLASAQTGVDEALLRAVIHAESGFNPAALSIKGAQGLMQLMPGTASDLGVRNPFDVGENIRGGARYLAMLLKTFNGNIGLAAAAYNAGADAVRKYGGVPPYDETRVYVKRVALLRDRYLKALKPPAFAATGSR
ncbi:MAG: transglycosylase SLT domain-containing protein [Rhodanobacteraceae bacterium]